MHEWNIKSALDVFEHRFNLKHTCISHLTNILHKIASAIE